MYEAIRQIELVVRSEKDREFRKLAAAATSPDLLGAFDEFPFRGKASYVAAGGESVGESRRIGNGRRDPAALELAANWRCSISGLPCGSIWDARCESGATPN